MFRDMRVEPVEIYSDEANAAVLRHPGRRFPGSLIQGDDLYQLCLLADEAAKDARGQPGFKALNRLRNALWSRLNGYKAVLDDHGAPLPFSEQPTL